MYTKYRKSIERFLTSTILISFVIFPFQEQIYSLLNVGMGFNAWKGYYGNDGEVTIRFAGLFVHPTAMGIIILFFLFMIMRKKKYITKIILSVLLFLTRTRSILLGIPISFFSLVKRNFQIVLIMGIIFLIILIIPNIPVIAKVLDSSALRHFNDLFVDGPKAITQYWQGNGLGTVSPYISSGIEPIIHIESDLFLAIIQVGIFTVVAYFLIISMVIKKLKFVKRNCPELIQTTNYLIIMTILLNVGCLVFPYYTMRVITNFVWIELGFFFANQNSHLSKGCNPYNAL
jgi:hypothetical protein